MAKLANVKALARRVTGKGKAVRLAAGQAYKAGMAKAGAGIVPALIVGGAVQTGGLALANHGYLSIRVGQYRLPVIGTLGAVVLASLGVYLRRRPVSKILYASATALAISQVVDVAKHGIRVPNATPEKKQ